MKTFLTLAHDEHGYLLAVLMCAVCNRQYLAENTPKPGDECLGCGSRFVGSPDKLKGKDWDEIKQFHRALGYA